jgi:hypothetical protein
MMPVIPIKTMGYSYPPNMYHGYHTYNRVMLRIDGYPDVAFLGFPSVFCPGDMGATNQESCV